MSGVTGPNMVTDGLFMYFDAANVQSYPGSGTTWNDLSNNNFQSTDVDGNLSIANYTPSSAGSTAKALISPNNIAEYVSIPDNVLFDFRGAMSWDFVACMENTSDRQSIWSQINTGSPWHGMGVASLSLDSNAQLSWWPGNYYPGTGWWASGITTTINKWWYCAGTVSGSAFKMYARTVGASTMSTATLTDSNGWNGATSSNTFRIGDNGTSGQASHCLDGAIAFVKLYNRQLSDAEVTQNYNAIKSRFGL
tara:strand:- start:24 stop:776 length:753 start_codon:yes stop_codon:yes gene_type:complete